VRRSRLIANLIALTVLLCGALILTTPGAEADTANPEIAYEGWFARNRPPSAQVDTCFPPTSTLTTTTARPCGPVGAPAYPTPQAKATGAYVVASGGGDAGDDANTGGDSGWAAFQWDLSNQSGASVTKFEVSIAQLADNNGFNQGDTWKWDSKTVDRATGAQVPAPPPPIQACNVLEGWGSENGSNPWDARPTDSASCVPVKSTSTLANYKTTWTNSSGTNTDVTVTTALFTFDLTTFAQSWADGTGYGIVIRPGTPSTPSNLSPFQLTFSGYYDPGTSSQQCNVGGAPGCTTAPRTVPPPKVAFEFTPAVEDDFGGGDDFGDIDTGEEFFEDITTTGDEGVLEAIPDIDIIPTDEGSEPLPEDIAVPSADDGATSSDLGGRTTRPISRDTGFPWIVLLLLPLVAIAFWGTGTALGPVGDPVPTRRGGVSRVLAQRQAANGGSDLHKRY
jgi:hypothetical protein